MIAAERHGADVTRFAQATAHSVRARQWVVARLPLERRQERDRGAALKALQLGMREGNERVIKKERRLRSLPRLCG